MTTATTTNVLVLKRSTHKNTFSLFILQGPDHLNKLSDKVMQNMFRKIKDPTCCQPITHYGSDPVLYCKI